MNSIERSTKPFTPLENLRMMPSRVSNRMTQLVNSIPQTLGFQNEEASPTKMPSLSMPSVSRMASTITSIPSRIASRMEEYQPEFIGTASPSTSISQITSYFTPTNILIFILILVVLGFNVFRHLETISKYLASLGLNVFKGTTEVTRKTLEKATEGTKVAVDVAGGTLTGGLKQIERTVETKRDLEPQKRILPDTSGSSVQLPKRKGYCYVGSQENNRTCMEVNKNDVCMSGEVFPTLDVCINPSLRA